MTADGAADDGGASERRTDDEGTTGGGAEGAGTTDGAWGRTVEELHALAADRRGAGWEVVDVAAGHTTPEPPEAGDADRFGFVHVLPGDAAPDFEAAFEGGGFAESEVYRRVAGDRLYLVTEVRAPERRTAILLAGAVDYGKAVENLRGPAREAGAMYVHAQTLDWTHLGTFRHDDPELFFPGDA